jgi:hypothetical protein
MGAGLALLASVMLSMLAVKKPEMNK